jgi:hypothetical protein
VRRSSRHRNENYKLEGIKNKDGSEITVEQIAKKMGFSIERNDEMGTPKDARSITQDFGDLMITKQVRNNGKVKNIPRLAQREWTQQTKRVDNLNKLLGCVRQ